MKIWQKHILGKLIKTFFFLLFCIFAIYVIVDLSIHGVRFLSKSGWIEVARYYLHTFATLLDLFLSLSFLLSTLRVLFALNAAREIVALQMAGLSKKKLLTPFFLFAGFLSLISYANSQWLSPSSEDSAQEFKISVKPKKYQKPKKIRVNSAVLEDGSELVYQSYDPSKNELYDVFWIRTPNDIWHVKHLELSPVQGRQVNHLTRNSAKQFENAESFASLALPQLPWNEELVLQKFVCFENRPLLTLLKQASAYSAEKASLFTHLYYKVFVPLTPFLVLIAIGPLALRFSRNHPLFLIVAASIFSLIALKIILEGMLILGETQVLPAFIAIFGPFAIVLSFSLPSFVRMR
jgi:lipopolysaccharide export system permease protein